MMGTTLKAILIYGVQVEFEDVTELQGQFDPDTGKPTTPKKVKTGALRVTAVGGDQIAVWPADKRDDYLDKWGDLDVVDGGMIDHYFIGIRMAESNPGYDSDPVAVSNDLPVMQPTFGGVEPKIWLVPYAG